MPLPYRFPRIRVVVLNLFLLCLFTAQGNALAFSLFSLYIPKTTVTIFRSFPIFSNQMNAGATHAQEDADSWNNPQAVASAKHLMQTSLHYQNQHIMGWGVDDPEPSPGVYDWHSLDERVELMRDTKATMVLTLCCAPGWMRPEGYQDDWKYLETAPAPEHIEDFADLAARVALCYPDVKYFQVWNELKGMWSTSPGATFGISNLNRWDYERYTTLYNAVFDAIKTVRPDAKLGGPYVVMDSDGNASAMSNLGPGYHWGTLDQRSLDVITFWLQHKHGADFIAIDGASANRDGVWLVNEFATAQKFVDVYKWIRTQPNGGSTLPIWWAEWYAGRPENAPRDEYYYDALMTSDEIYTLKSGASALFIWEPQGDSHGFSFPEGIWNNTKEKEGGQPTAYYFATQAFKKYFSSGTVLYQVKASTNNVTVLASPIKTILVNCLSIPQEVDINGKFVVLAPYGVVIINTSLGLSWFGGVPALGIYFIDTERTTSCRKDNRRLRKSLTRKRSSIFRVTARASQRLPSACYP